MEFGEQILRCAILPDESAILEVDPGNNVYKISHHH